MEYNTLINELLDLLDKDINIIKIKSLKEKLKNDETLKQNLLNYRLVSTIENKKKLYENIDYKEYLICENNVNFLISNIKSKFNNLNNRKCHNESN